MKKYLVGVCGFFGINGITAGGQSVRTTNVTDEIEKNIGKNNLKRLNTANFIKRPISFFTKLVALVAKSKNMILLPASNSVKILIPFITIFKKVFNTKVYYVVIGGWLPELLLNKKHLVYFIKKLDGLFVQTTSIKNALNEIGIEKVYLFPNFKQIGILSGDEITYNYKKPLKICFFSRLTEKKGIEELIEKVIKINSESKEIIYMLDIYGLMDSSYVERFNVLKEKFPYYINYCGIADSNNTVDVLKDYFLQVFPTKFKTEGFPGSILDSYCAGVPVLASRWNSWNNIIEEGKSGITFEFENFDDMEEKLIEISKNPDIINKMKKNCLEKALDYKPEKVIKILLDIIFNK